MAAPRRDAPAPRRAVRFALCAVALAELDVRADLSPTPGDRPPDTADPTTSSP